MTPQCCCWCQNKEITVANNSQQKLFEPDGYVLSNPGNSFTSLWGDKRSGQTCSISLVFAGSGTPDGYAHVETSNAPEIPTWGGVLGGLTPTDASTFPGSTVNILSTGVTKWEVLTSARWVRVVYVSTVDSSNLAIHVYYNVPFASQ